MIVRCTGASSSRRVSIRASLVSSRTCKDSASNEPFTSGSFLGEVPWGSSSSGPLHHQLRAEDLVVELAVAQELFVGAHRGDLAVIEDQDQVRVANRAYPLGDDEGGPAGVAHHPVECLLNGSLGLGVHSRGAVVEDQ